MRKVILAVLMFILPASFACGEVAVSVGSTGFNAIAPKAEYFGNMGVYYSEEVIVHLAAHKNGVGIMCMPVNHSDGIFLTVNSNESLINITCTIYGGEEDFFEITPGTILNYSRPISQGISDSFNETDRYKSYKSIKLFLTEE